MRESIVLYGAGATGRQALKFLRAQGIEPLCFADSDPEKWGIDIDGLMVKQPSVCGASDLTYWVACATRHDYAVEIREQLKQRGVKMKPLYECLPVQHGLPPRGTQQTIAALLSDVESLEEWCDQYEFRQKPDYDRQRPPSDINDIYFPEFITHLDFEHFVDAGAASGDTIAAFKERWPKFSKITAFEPDRTNMDKLREATWKDDNILRFDKALSDHMHTELFTANGDYSSHLGGTDGERVMCWKLDDLYVMSDRPPTYIKADIEGSEMQMLWGARRILKEHKPVLAICAYHHSEDLWSIPLLIHALQPEYRIFLRRYAEGAWELVYYAVPVERLK